MHMMIDVEALRLKQPWLAPLLSVGVAVFTNRGEVVFSDTIYLNSKAWPIWAMAEPETAHWWNMQGETYVDLIEKVLHEGITPEEICQWIGEVMSAHSVKQVWFAGPTYDQVMLEAYFDHCQMPRPWKFSDCRDFRTIRKQHPYIYDRLVANRKGLHVAEEDALFQVSVLRAISDATGEEWM